MSAGALIGALTAPALAQVTAINVEVDYFVADDHTHMPQPAEIDALVEMFACHGITLTIDVDDPITETLTNQIMMCPNTSDPFFFACDGPSSFKSIKDAFYDRAGQSGWHYCVFGHRYDIGDGTDSSGVAQLLGADFIVTLADHEGEVGTPYKRAATFAHELGHNLGLRHFSPLSTGTAGNYQPNYASVMSYQYQLRGLRSRMQCLPLVGGDHLFKELDYSNGRLPSLAEATLHEATGLGMVPVDWNCDGDTADIVAEDFGEGSTWCNEDEEVYDVVVDWDDWSNLVDTTFILPEGPTSEPEIVTCMTYREYVALAAVEEGACPPSLVMDECQAGEMYWLDGSYGGVQLGTGEMPFQTFDFAVASALPESVLYIQPGTYTSTLEVTKSVVLVGGLGGVVLR